MLVSWIVTFMSIFSQFFKLVQPVTKKNLVYPNTYRFKLFSFQKLFCCRYVNDDSGHCWHTMALRFLSSTCSVSCVHFKCLNFLLWLVLFSWITFPFKSFTLYLYILHTRHIQDIIFCNTHACHFLQHGMPAISHKSIMPHVASTVLNLICVWVKDDERSWSSSNISQERPRLLGSFLLNTWSFKTWAGRNEYLKPQEYSRVTPTCTHHKLFRRTEPP